VSKSTAFIEVFQVPKKKLYRWRKVGANRRKILQSCEAFKQPRYAAFAARQEYPAIKDVRYPA
jgi:hypothetical protein